MRGVTGSGRTGVDFADKAFEDGDSQWAAELATRLIRINHDDMEARRLKAAAFRKLGYAEMNAIWRNWYLSGARGLEIVDPEMIRAGMARLARFFASPDLVAALPARLCVRERSRSRDREYCRSR